MSGNDYREALAALNLSQVSAAKLLGVDPRTSRRWAADERDVNPSAAILLRLLLAGKITVADLEEARG